MYFAPADITEHLYPPHYTALPQQFTEEEDERYLSRRKMECGTKESCTWKREPQRWKLLLVLKRTNSHCSLIVGHHRWEVLFPKSLESGGRVQEEKRREYLLMYYHFYLLFLLVPTYYYRPRWDEAEGKIMLLINVCTPFRSTACP